LECGGKRKRDAALDKSKADFNELNPKRRRRFALSAHSKIS
jgi:hypothetical protein